MTTRMTTLTTDWHRKKNETAHSKILKHESISVLAVMPGGVGRELVMNEEGGEYLRTQ
jgi:hypothetical protein